ncbi:D-alanyl-D-alanine carboxypeptidase [Streptomyces eurocidicus]|uniref:D-alanyl-D-alanine carboxypeptidase n=1 Tax=Streptomyces eurocidicus TaxID=66423 RepID=A0A2N8P005_STREU|nr:serine hydrolase [Streptomyces eurocidicus]MBB5118872.1 D-alanyl-D-alanine carboxypeptidase (penicillin-binding protein 5/6) [Streptomyces eurocidicus]MBF6051320.1 serine hydrolase [Streptomyces eurocidicus]PNE34352.1 D-alanyl-D-alanine carboxypeptidase [Streptomyces eurocidicus]
MERCEGRPARRWGAALIASTAAVAVALPATSAEAASGPAVAAKGAFLLDSGKNRQLWAKDADTRRQMASTTKIMTATVVLDTRGVDLDKKVTVKQSYRDYVTRNGASTADLRTGDKMTVRQLLYGLMLPSGCDAAYALADTFGTGNSESARTASFISKMNKKAADLGMKNTRYDSFDGISAKGANYTSPRDSARLAGHALSNSTFRTVVRTTSTQQKAANVNRTYYWDNTNKLLGSYKGALGIKTGTGTAAGPCLVFAAQRDGRTVVGVILNDPAQRYPDAVKMLDWAFKTKTRSDVKLRQLPDSAQQD